MSDKDKRVHETAKQYIGYWLKVVDFADDVLVKAHDAVAVVGEVANEAVEIAQDALYSASVKLDEYRDFVNSNVEAGDAKYDTTETPEGPVVERNKPLKPTADMSRAEKIDFIIDAYLLNDTPQQKQVLNTSSDAALTQAVNVIKAKNGLQ